MKTVVLFFTAILFSAGAFAESNLADFVTTKDGTRYFRNVRMGVTTYLVAITTKGEKVKFTKDEVIAYRDDGNYFKKMPLHNAKREIVSLEFMKLIDVEDGFSLYQYSSYDVNGVKMERFFIFEEEKYIVEMDKTNYPHLVSFFEEY